MHTNLVSYFTCQSLKVIETLSTIAQNPLVSSIALPIFGTLGVASGIISGYEIGQTLVLRARGQWNPSLARPAALLVTAIAIAIFSPPVVATSIAIAILGAFILGACKGYLKDEKRDLAQKQTGITPANFVAIKNPPSDHAAHLIWGLMAIADGKGESFSEGSFVLEGNSARTIFDQLMTIPKVYSRRSSHFPGQCDKQYGLDFTTCLPANKRTILFGMVNTHDGQQVLFIKPENWGANHQDLKHFANHTFDFIHAQYVKRLRPGYDDRPGTAKERIPHEWRQEISTINHFGWSQLSTEQKESLISKGLAKETWKDDTYRTGREVYIKLD